MLSLVRPEWKKVQCHYLYSPVFPYSSHVSLLTYLKFLLWPQSIPHHTPHSTMSNTSTSIPFNLALPSPSTLPILLGHSNYTLWHSAINPILTSHQPISTLLSGSWTEPRLVRPTLSPTIPPAPNTNTKANTQTQAQAHAQALAAWDQANLVVCRFIRGTLALNVLPFVRRYSDAKLLWDALVALYGEANGIARAGGPGLERRSAASVGVEVGEGQWDRRNEKGKAVRFGGSGSGCVAARVGSAGTVAVGVPEETERHVDVIQDRRKKRTGMGKLKLHTIRREVAIGGRKGS